VEDRDQWEAAVTAKLGAIGAKLNDMDAKLMVVARIPELVESALKAVATESRNAADIKDLQHRLSIAEAKLCDLSQPQPS